MISPSIEKELQQHLSLLPVSQQRRVLDFARMLLSDPNRQVQLPISRGVKGSTLLAFAGFIPADELLQMKTAIEADCEQVDVVGW